MYARILISRDKICQNEKLKGIFEEKKRKKNFRDIEMSLEKNDSQIIKFRRNFFSQIADFCGNVD